VRSLSSAFAEMAMMSGVRLTICAVLSDVSCALKHCFRAGPRAR